MLYVDHVTFSYGMCALFVIPVGTLRFIVHVRGTRLPSCVKYVLLRTSRCVIYVTYSRGLRYGARYVCFVMQVTLYCTCQEHPSIWLCKIRFDVCVPCSPGLRYVLLWYVRVMFPC